MAGKGEFAEFDIDEATFDAMLAQGEPAELVPPPVRVSVRTVADDVVRTITYVRGLPISVESQTEGTVARRSRIQQIPAHHKTVNGKLAG